MTFRDATTVSFCVETRGCFLKLTIFPQPKFRGCIDGTPLRARELRFNVPWAKIWSQSEVTQFFWYFFRMKNIERA